MTAWTNVPWMQNNLLVPQAETAFKESTKRVKIKAMNEQKLKEINTRKVVRLEGSVKMLM